MPIFDTLLPLLLIIALMVNGLVYLCYQLLILFETIRHIFCNNCSIYSIFFLYMTFATLHTDVSVQYRCGCDEFCNLELLYFCQTCQKLNCVYCVNNQIDQYFCRNCMETMVWTDIRKLNYLCKNCYSCPRCFHILNTVTSSDNLHKNDSGCTTLYSLICLHCRWSTREAGLPDSSLVTDFLPHITSLVNYTRYLIELYKIQSEAELNDYILMNTVYSSSRNFLDRMTKNRLISTPVYGNAFCDRSKASMLPKMNDKAQLNSTNYFQVNVDFPEGIPDNFYSQPFSSSSNISLKQRILQTINQSDFSILLKPQKLKISSKTIQALSLLSAHSLQARLECLSYSFQNFAFCYSACSCSSRIIITC